MWFPIKDIRSVPIDTFLPQCLNHGRFIDERSSCGIDEDSLGLHQLQLLLSDEMCSIRVAGNMQCNDVRLFENLLWGKQTDSLFFAVFFICEYIIP